MSNLTERANYLKGLADGLQLNTEKSSTRLLLEVIDLLSDMADEIEALAKFPPESGLHFTYDGVHPVQAGNELIARSILRALGVKNPR